MFGRRRASRAAAAGQPAWTAGEQYVRDAVLDYLKRIEGKAPVARGVSEALFTPAHAGLLGAIYRYPELLTDRGAAFFAAVVGFTELLGEPRVTASVRDCQAALEAVRKVRA